MPWISFTSGALALKPQISRGERIASTCNRSRLSVASYCQRATSGRPPAQTPTKPLPPESSGRGRQAQSIGAATISPPPSTAVVNPTTAVQANLPTDNSSTTNTPGVSSTIPEPANVATDNSPSVLTAPDSAITALIPNTSAFIDFSEGEVYLVPDPVDPTTVQLFIATPGSEAMNSQVTLQVTNSPVTLHAINFPVVSQANNPPGMPQPNNSAAGIQVNNSPVTGQIGVPTSMQHIGQDIETALQKRVKPLLGPQPEDLPLIDIVGPPRSLEPVGPPKPDNLDTVKPKAEKPESEKPKSEPPKSDAPIDATRPPEEQAPPRRQCPRLSPRMVVWPLAGPGASPPEAMRPRTNDRTGLSALFGVVAIAGTGYRLTMSESERFGMHWLPRRVCVPPVGTASDARALNVSPKLKYPARKYARPPLGRGSFVRGGKPVYHVPPAWGGAGREAGARRASAGPRTAGTRMPSARPF